MYIVIMTLSIISIYLAEKNYNYANLLDIKSSYRGLRGLPNKVHFVNKMRILLINNKYYTINEQIQNIAQKKDTLCRRMYN